MSTRFVLIPVTLTCALLAASACSHAQNQSSTAVTPPPFLLGSKSAKDEPTGAIETPADASAAPAANATPDTNQRLAALELDMAAIKIELSRVSEFDSRLTALEGGNPHSATKLEPAISYDDPPPPKLKVPEHAADAPLPAPEEGKKKSAAILPTDNDVPASVAALEPVAPATHTPAASADVAPAPVKAPAVKERAPAPKVSMVSTAAAGDFAVQLASYGSPAGVAKGWSGLSAKAGALLSDLTPKREEANVAGKTVYRLKAGPFSDAASAKQRCAGLQAAGHSCLVTAFTGSTLN